MKFTKSQLEQVIKEELKAHEKDYVTMVEQNLKIVQKEINELLPEVDEDLRTHFYEHRNNIFISTLDENTGVKTYKPQSIDELLTECQNDKSKSDYNRYDHIYEILDESFAHERSIYFGEDDLLSEVDWEKRAAELETGEETEEYTAAGEKKGVAQRTKEKVKGAWKKGKLYFFLKIAEAGLKLALTASKGVFKLIQKLLFKAIKKMLAAWAQGKAKVSGVWLKVKAWGESVLQKLMEKIMKPFFWIATKLTSNAEKAAELAPLIMNITILSLMLAWVYATGGLSIFAGATDGLAAGMQDTIEAAPEDIAGAMCIAEIQGLTTKKLITEECEFIDMQGKEVSNAVIAKVMRQLVKELNDRVDEAKLYTHSWENLNIEKDVPWYRGGGTEIVSVGEEYNNVAEALGSDFEQTLQALKYLDGEAREVIQSTAGPGGGGTALELSDITDFGGKAGKILQARISAVQEHAGDLPVISDEELKGLAGTISTVYHVASEATTGFEAASGAATAAREYSSGWGETRLLGITMKESMLTENQVKRFQVLAGVFKKA